MCAWTEIGVFEDAVSLPGSQVLSDAEEPQAEISAGDEDERVPLQCARYVKKASQWIIKAPFSCDK